MTTQSAPTPWTVQALLDLFEVERAADVTAAIIETMKEAERRTGMSLGSAHAVLAVLDALDSVAAETGATLAQISLAWLIARGFGAQGTTTGGFRSRLSSIGSDH